MPLSPQTKRLSGELSLFFYHKFRIGWRLIAAVNLADSVCVCYTFRPRVFNSAAKHPRYSAFAVFGFTIESAGGRFVGDCSSYHCVVDYPISR